MKFISMWVLPEEAGRFRYDSEHIVGDTLRCPIRTRLHTFSCGRQSSPMKTLSWSEKLALLNCIEQKEWFDDDSPRRISISLEAITGSGKVFQAWLYGNWTINMAIIEQPQAIGRREDYNSDPVPAVASDMAWLDERDLR